MSDDLDPLYRARFGEREQPRRAALWDTLCRGFFQRYVPADACLLDLGAGTCEFVNAIRCRRRIAVDLQEGTERWAAPGVEVLRSPSWDLAVEAGTVDVVFASNFFEHLPTVDHLLGTLDEVHRVLRPDGRLLVLQPNVRLVGGAYWDFIDHHLALTEKSLVEALRLRRFEPLEVLARFLPYTTKSRLPQWPVLVRLYLTLRPAQWLLGTQSWIVARALPRS